MNDLTQNELLKNFIGSEKKYIHYCENNSKIAFNWAAFLFGIYWLLYRKMYLYAFCMLIIATFLILVLLLSGINQHYFMSACLGSVDISNWLRREEYTPQGFLDDMRRRLRNLKMVSPLSTFRALPAQF
ncbi:DUF2628 domain-containing protein [Acinetobacter gerneri]|jgi:hypothetical protein|uniref:DUF2628 domain-containing protein n=1 Tax=Acinetobacter gerneri TaxID=202952 RepID=UPI0023F3C353|nr:DUF2628 domain-containing protein [Acinetobacter gerneri]MCH4244953.1 DUF2628 domain-containing protein [Acinetobacter gerneri]